MTNYYHNPENALKRANEFLDLNKYEEAVDCLYEVIKNKKNRLLKTTHEAIINKFIDICVQYKMSGSAKNGLYLYRVICQGTNIKSWEDAVRRMFLLVEERVDCATEESLAIKTKTDVLGQHLELNNLLENAVFKDNDEKLNQLLLLPWLKFNWECYRFCLEILRNNQIEKFYHQVAQNAVKFCLKFSRKTEFRKLCSLLRLHLGYLQKQQNRLFLPVVCGDPLVLYLETVLIELDTALELELWQEAFRAIEDLHLVIDLIKKPTNAKILATYYEKLSLVFLKADDLLYHAAALFRYFLLYREMKKNLTLEEISALSSGVVLAVLAVPFALIEPTIDLIAENDLAVIEKKDRVLSTLLNFPINPTRKRLVKDIESFNILQSAQEDVQELFTVLEVNVDPLNMGSKLSRLRDSIKLSPVQALLERYLSPILNMSIVRLLSQLSRIYKTITLTKFMKLVLIDDVNSVERIIVDSARRYAIPVRLDHFNNCLHFTSGCNLFRRLSIVDGPEIEQLSKEGNGDYLSRIHPVLRKLSTYLRPEEFRIGAECIREKLVKQYLQKKNTDRKEILERKKIIEKHKEMMENARIKKEEDEKKSAFEKQMKFEFDEKERLLKEAEEREKQRCVRQQEEVKRQILFEKLENLKKSDIVQIGETIELEDLEKLDPDIIWLKHIEKINKEKKELISRLQKQEKFINHMERAKRVEELPLLSEKYMEERALSKELWDKDEQAKINIALEQRALNLQNKERFLTMKEDLKVFLRIVKEGRLRKYQSDLLDFDEQLNSERSKRLEERRIKRMTQRKLEWLKVQEEEKRLKERRNSRSVKNDEARASKYAREKSPDKVFDTSYSRQWRIEQKVPSAQSFHLQKEVFWGACRVEARPYSLFREYLPDVASSKSFNEHYPSLYRDDPSRKQSPSYKILKREGTLEIGSSKNSAFSSWDSSSLNFDSENTSKQYSRSCKITSNQSSERNTKTGSIPESFNLKPLGKAPTEIQGYPSSLNTVVKSSYSARVFHPSQESRREGSKLEEYSENLGFRDESFTRYHLQEGDIQKYETRNSCTPWAKLQRDKSGSDGT